MKAMLFQTGWNYSQDGPGNRLVMHFQGCNFDCPWCSNPEGRSIKGELFVRKELLTPGVCPKGAITDSGLNRDLCLQCGERECLTTMKNKGITYTSRSYDLTELIRMAVESKPLFFDGGGVTISGGEATLQFKALQSLLLQLGEKGIHRALETNGSHENLEELFPHTDLLIFDIKHWDFSRAANVLKNKGTHVIENLRKCCRLNVKTLLRITLIPGFNDSVEDLEHFSSLIRDMQPGDNFRLELLNFHEYGRNKWEAIGQEYKGPEMKGLPPVEQIHEKHKNIFESRGLKLVST